MFTKIVYVVVGSEENLYVQQLLLSLYSLRKYNINAEVLITTDTSTSQYLKTIDLEPYNVKIIEVECPKRLTAQQQSRFIKTSLRKIVNGDYLFIDTDTIICGDLSEIDKVPYDIAAVKDKHLSIKAHPKRSDIIDWAKKVDWIIQPETDVYFNSGIFYVKDTAIAHSVYDEWHKTWKKGIEHNLNIDQPSLGYANYKNGGIIKELGGEWNCQITDNGLNYLSEAKIIHYFASMQKWDTPAELPYKLRDKHYLELIKQNDNTIPEEIKRLVDKPKCQFQEKLTIISGINEEIVQLRIFRIARRIYAKWPNIIKSFDNVIKKFRP